MIIVNQNSIFIIIDIKLRRCLSLSSRNARISMAYALGKTRTNDRNYTFCALSLLIACLATYSLYRIIKRDRKVGFEQILLLINSITSFLIFGMMLFYDVFNSHIILLLV